MIVTYTFGISLLAIVFFLAFKVWENRRDEVLFSKIRSSADSALSLCVDGSKNLLPETARKCVRLLSRCEQHAKSSLFPKISISTSNQYKKLTSFTRGKKEVQNGNKSEYFEDIADHKQKVTGR